MHLVSRRLLTFLCLIVFVGCSYGTCIASSVVASEEDIESLQEVVTDSNDIQVPEILFGRSRYSVPIRFLQYKIVLLVGLGFGSGACTLLGLYGLFSYLLVNQDTAADMSVFTADTLLNPHFPWHDRLASSLVFLEMGLFLLILDYGVHLSCKGELYGF